MKWWKEKGLEKLFQKDNLIILVLSGVLLFIIALPTEDGGKEEKKEAMVRSGEVQTEQMVDAEPMGEEFDYAAYLEERLKGTLQDVSGVGQVEVMITLQSSEELVLEKDRPVTNSTVEETDAQGGSRITNQTESSETTIYSTTGSDSEPYVVKRILPEVEGVLVVAEGAGIGSINRSITEIVQALFDVEMHKIKVVPMSVK